MASSASSMRTGYRAVLRELSKHYKSASARQQAVVAAKQKARAQLDRRAGAPDSAFDPTLANAPAGRTKDVYSTANLRTAASTDSLSAFDAHEIADYLKNQRQYKELLQRYQSGPQDTQERVRMSARRVGLDVDEL